MNAILVGYGEIGKGLEGYYGRYHNIHVFDLKHQKDKYLDEYDVMLVAIPYDDNFLGFVNEYKKIFKPKVIIIFSTVQIGTTRQIEDAVHSPIEGKHPYLEESIAKWQVFLGGENNTAFNFFVQANKIVHQLYLSDHTEFLKLQSTTNYGVMIEYARYVNEICENIDLDYNTVKTFNMAYNHLYKSMGMSNYQRYILDAPSGNLGGHCVVPNAKLLDEMFPSVFTQEIFSNKEEDKCYH